MKLWFRVATHAVDFQRTGIDVDDIARLGNDVTIAYRSPALDAAGIECVVALPTFRRPDHLRATLESLSRQQTGLRFAVVVMENDAEGLAGLKAASAFFERGTLAGLVVVAAERGNCHAYNAGFTTALDVFPRFRQLAVIDDDECAAPHWLEALNRVAHETGAALVGGPQVPVFETAASGRATHPVFQPPYAVSGRVPILYSSGNVMIARRVLETMPRPFLDPAFNFIGGGDSDFYRRCRNAGFDFAWSTEAVVLETMPARRAESSWLRARGLRNGAISALLERRQRPGPTGRLRTLGKSAALLAAAPLRSVVLAARTRSLSAGLYRMHVALGRFQAEFGMVAEQYRNPESN
jgi:hypothetical protein